MQSGHGEARGVPESVRKSPAGCPGLPYNRFREPLFQAFPPAASGQPTRRRELRKRQAEIERLLSEDSVLQTAQAAWQAAGQANQAAEKELQP
ncbi:MAG: hypothetical protein KIS85_02910 [Anaerolineales bacterium]|nr:hypothetical protein [Anaerolineales bacterium]